MALKVRRVVTGHDAAGKAIVTIDEVSQNVTLVPMNADEARRELASGKVVATSAR